VHPSAGLDILEKRKIACLYWESHLGHPACSVITIQTTTCQFWSVCGCFLLVVCRIQLFKDVCNSLVSYSTGIIQCSSV
jgi:hypothetical protein